MPPPAWLSNKCVVCVCVCVCLMHQAKAIAAQKAKSADDWKEKALQLQREKNDALGAELRDRLHKVRRSGQGQRGLCWVLVGGGDCRRSGIVLSAA
jgi:hypothetical protein